MKRTMYSALVLKLRVGTPRGAVRHHGRAFPLEAWERGSSLLRWGVVLLLLGGLPILLHGCHGDDDNELFAPLLRHGHHHGPSRELERLQKLLVDLGK